MCFFGYYLILAFFSEAMHFCLCMQISRRALITSQSLHAFYIDGNNPYCSIWTCALHMYNTLLLYACDVCMYVVVIISSVCSCILCDLKCLVISAIAIIIYGG